MKTSIKEGLNDKALNSLKENKLDEARKLFEIYRRSNPGIESFNNLAWFYFYKDGDKLDALDLIESIDFNMLESYYPLAIYGDLLMEEGDYVSATQVYKNALYMGGDNIVMFNLGLSYFLIEDYNKSAEWFLKSYKSGLENSIDYYFVALYYDDKKKFKRELRARGEKLKDKILLSELYYEVGDYKKAYNIFKESLKEKDIDILALNKYIDTLIRLNKKELASEVIENYISKFRELIFSKNRIKNTNRSVKIDFGRKLNLDNRLDGNYLFGVNN